jgi:hypothetical protein
MKRIALISSVCLLAASAAAGAGTKPLPALRVDVAGWSPAASYIVGQTVPVRFTLRNRAHAKLKLVEVRLTLPNGWKLVTVSTPRPDTVSGATVVWRYTNLAALPAGKSTGGGARRLTVNLRIGGKTGTVCMKTLVRALRPATVPVTTRGCTKVVDAVFH